MAALERCDQIALLELGDAQRALLPSFLVPCMPRSRRQGRDLTATSSFSCATIHYVETHAAAGQLDCEDGQHEHGEDVTGQEVGAGRQ